MKSDKELKKDVLDELGSKPGVNAEDIGVIVKDGVVTLTGSVGSYYEKLSAMNSAKRVAGVKALAVEIEVKVPGMGGRTDADIARAAENSLAWDISVPEDRIKVTVEQGWITLDGTVDWLYQKSAAENAIQYLAGVKGISNLITLTPTQKVSPAEVKASIEKALKRNATFEAQRITVTATDAKVTLRGSVRSLADREEAERAAWNAPGVLDVEDEIDIAA
jgi:osmotically-inducible protein OsmY